MSGRTIYVLIVVAAKIYGLIREGGFCWRVATNRGTTVQFCLIRHMYEFRGRLIIYNFICLRYIIPKTYYIYHDIITLHVHEGRWLPKYCHFVFVDLTLSGSRVSLHILETSGLSRYPHVCCAFVIEPLVLANGY